MSFVRLNIGFSWLFMAFHVIFKVFFTVLQGF